MAAFRAWGRYALGAAASVAIGCVAFGAGRFVDCNAQAEKLYGCTREELLAAGPDRFYPPEQFDARAARELIVETEGKL